MKSPDVDQQDLTRTLLDKRIGIVIVAMGICMVVVSSMPVGIQATMGGFLGALGSAFVTWPSGLTVFAPIKFSQRIRGVLIMCAFWAIVGFVTSSVFRTPFVLVMKHLVFVAAFSIGVKVFALNKGLEEESDL
jgi:hypothetical protein